MRREKGWMVALKICRDSMRKWTSDPRVLSVLLLVCLFEWTLIQPVREECIKQGLSISCWYFPFLFVSVMNTIFFYFGVLLMFCDAPFTDRHQMYVILRSGKKSWFYGKIMYVFVASCLYFLLMLAVSILEFVPYVGFSLEWEDVLNGLSISGGTGIAAINIPRDIILHFSPVQAVLLTYSMNVLVGFFLGLLIFYMNLQRIPNLGIGIALAFILMTGLQKMLIVDVGWKFLYYSPVSWVNISLYTREYGGVPIGYAYSVLIIACLIFIGLIMHKSKSYSIEAMEEI